MKLLVLLNILTLYALANPMDQFNKCPSITEGKYLLRYTFNSSEKPSVIEFKGVGFRNYRNQIVIDSGVVKPLIDCIYILDSDIYKKTDTAGLAGLIHRSFGPSCIETTGSNGDTIFFRTTYSGNLHITQNKGELIKLRNGRQ